MTCLKSENVPARTYNAEAILTDGLLTDIAVRDNDRTRLMLGRGGALAELKLIPQELRPESGRPDPSLIPVLIGSGLGHALRHLLDTTDGPIAVADAETPILAVSGCRERYADDPRVIWLDQPDPATVALELSRLCLRQGGGRLIPVVSPLYPRLAPEYYRPILQAVQENSRADFWTKARRRRFQDRTPRLLLLTSKYFLIGEITAACDRLDIPYLLVDIGGGETGCADYVARLLQAAIEFKPDFALTINHLGVDREGVLIDLLARLRLPLASWFVDNPHLVLYLYDKLVNPWTAIFTWDKDNLDSLREMGFAHVFHLPLGTDVTRFRPDAERIYPLPPTLRGEVCFVGNSMIYKVGARLDAARPGRPLLTTYREVAAGFGAHPERSVLTYLTKHHPDLLTDFQALDSVERKLAYETLITWEATRGYRLGCLSQTLDFAPLIVGDKGWKRVLARESRPWTYHPELAYYDQLPALYPRCAINFNCTSRQMKGAVNQRVFDVPASGAFLLTDHQEQIEDLFEPGREVVTYSDPTEIPELIRRYLGHPGERRAVVEAARRRVLAEHTYDIRLRKLIEDMRRTYGQAD